MLLPVFPFRPTGPVKPFWPLSPTDDNSTTICSYYWWAQQWTEVLTFSCSDTPWPPDVSVIFDYGIEQLCCLSQGPQWLKHKFNNSILKHTKTATFWLNYMGNCFSSFFFNFHFISFYFLFFNFFYFLYNCASEW